MKTIVLYARRNTGVAALSLLKAKGHKVKVISDDENVLWLAWTLGCEIVTLDTMGSLDLFLCVHGNKRVPDKYLAQGCFVNVHPCLSIGLKGANPIKRYIEDKMTFATVDSHYMTNIIDEGKKIVTVKFNTPECKTFADFYNIAMMAYLVVINRTLKVLNI